MKHVPAVDSLRIVCAFVVFGMHLYAFPVQSTIAHLLQIAPAHEHAYHAVLVTNRSLFDGGAAVIVFFIISGICIHWPVRNRELEVGPFLVRRVVRVGLPLIICIALAQLAFGTIDFLDAVLWSLYCELIYYAIYPLLRALAARVGWSALLIASAVAAVVLAMQPDPGNGYFFAYGPSKTWLLGLPVWLSGVWLAEHVSFTAAPLSRRGLNMLRVAVWFIAAVILTLHDRHTVPIKWSMLVFVFPAGAWVVYEIRNAWHRGVHPALERAGAWSFSLYLCHKFAIALVGLSALPLDAPLGWTCALVLGIALSLSFYRSVELPSHALARWLARHTPTLLRVAPRRAMQTEAHEQARLRHDETTSSRDNKVKRVG